jgi:hypothetical protein
MTKRMMSMLYFLVGIVVATVLLLLAVYPYRPNTPLGWTLLAAVAIPVVLGLEYVGTRSLDNRYMNRLGPTARILLGVLVVGGIYVCIVALWQLVLPGMGTW